LAYKFKKKLDLVNLFVKNVCEIISTNPELEKAVIVPVPPRPGKIKETGWDQVEYLVKKLEKKGLPVCRCLKRKKSKVQKKLTLKERKENLQGRILPAGLIPKKALVIDDIITTGSTLEVCSNVLKENGSEEVYGLCLFYD
jgi:ComF family protein